MNDVFLFSSTYSSRILIDNAVICGAACDAACRLKSLRVNSATTLHKQHNNVKYVNVFQNNVNAFQI